MDASERRTLWVSFGLLAVAGWRRAHGLLLRQTTKASQQCLCQFWRTIRACARDVLGGAGSTTTTPSTASATAPGPPRHRLAAVRLGSVQPLGAERRTGLQGGTPRVPWPGRASCREAVRMMIRAGDRRYAFDRSLHHRHRLESPRLGPAEHSGRCGVGVRERVRFGARRSRAQRLGSAMGTVGRARDTAVGRVQLACPGSYAGGSLVAPLRS